MDGEHSLDLTGKTFPWVLVEAGGTARLLFPPAAFQQPLEPTHSSAEQEKEIPVQIPLLFSLLPLSPLPRSSLGTSMEQFLWWKSLAQREPLPADIPIAIGDWDLPQSWNSSRSPPACPQEPSLVFSMSCSLIPGWLLPLLRIFGFPLSSPASIDDTQVTKSNRNH